MIGCSSEAPSSATDSAIVAEDATEEASAVDAQPEVTTETSSEAGRNPGATCPGCEVTKCKDKLMACAMSSACVGWLKCMNECYKAPGAAACQQKCTTDMPTPQGAALTECKKESCAAECTPLD